MSSENAWSETRKSVTALGEQLRQHYDADSSDPAKQAQLETAMEGLGKAVNDVLDSLGKVLDDPEVRASSTRVAESFSQAVAATLAEIGTGMQQALRTKSGAASPADSPPPDESSRH